MKLLAQNGIGRIDPPTQIGPIANQTGSQGLSAFVSLLINIILTGSALIFLFMILFGGFQWLTSGGDKEKIKTARGRITHAIIGLAIVALASLLAQVIGKILGFNVFGIYNPPPNCGNLPPGVTNC